VKVAKKTSAPKVTLPNSAKIPNPLSRQSRPRVLSSKDGIYSFVGIGESNVPGGASERKHEFTA